MPRTRARTDISHRPGKAAPRDFLTQRGSVYQAAVEKSGAGVFALDASGAIIMVNPELCRLLGYCSEELIGRPIDDLLPAAGQDVRAPRHIDMTQVQAPSLRAASDMVARRKDGRDIEVRASLAPAVADGKTILVGTVVDISEQKRRDRLRDEFVATLSHELRTPITSIGAALGLLLADAGKTLSEPALQLIGIAHSNCQRLIRMTTDVLDLSKLEAGRMSFRFQRCEAGALLHDAVEASRALACNAQVVLALDPPSTPIPLYVDPDRFMQVMSNLLSNAIKFSPPGESIQVAAEARGGRIHISIRDHGPGIPADFRHRIFESFAQFDGDLVRRTGGTGLGLSIARTIVTQMHGQIGFDDALGGGTIFRIDWPEADYVQRWQSEIEAEQAAKTSRYGPG